MSERKYRLCDSFSALCFHYFLHEVLNIPLAITVFGRIGYIIRFHENLIISTIYTDKGMMMSDQKGNAFDLLLRHTAISQKAPDHNLTLLLLKLSVCVAVFFTA